MKKETLPSADSITTVPFEASNKIYISGKKHNIKVAMREIKIGEEKDKESLTVYDTSGPYTDPNATINVKKGLEKLRESWILERGDVTIQNNLSSEFGKNRLTNSNLDHLRFEHIKMPLKAMEGKNVSQMHYARKGIITPEMEYVAIRENQGLEDFHLKQGAHPGNRHVEFEKLSRTFDVCLYALRFFFYCSTFLQVLAYGQSP